MKRSKERPEPRTQSKLLGRIWGWPLLALLAGANALPLNEAFCNCFTPMSSMFKMGKHGGVLAAPPLANSIYGPQVGQADRAGWYVGQPQQYLGYGQQSPSKFSLFQPKWRGSLFGPKKWMVDWRMAGLGSQSQFYKPGYLYGWSANNPIQIQNPPKAHLLPPSSYQLSDQHQPYGYSTSGPGQPQYSPQLSSNDGWTGLPSSNYQLPPYNSQQQTFNYEYATLPPASSGNLIQPPARQQMPNNTNYPSKGGSTSRPNYNSSTKKSVLVANGGYDMFDAHQVGTGNYTLPPIGYSYPDWYSSVIDSPAKIAQQLYRTQKYRDSVTGGLK